jgi:hypothetical protein
MDTFCVLPWFSVELPSNSPCCLLPTNTDINQVKKDLLNGIKSPACSKCWEIESNGLKSKRLFENEFLDYKLDRDLELLKQDCSTMTTSTVLYQIATSNLCNQACVSCNSFDSTKWAEIEKRMSIAPAQMFTIELEKQNINYATARRISLLGGEPFFDPKTFEILENLVNNNNTDCFISLITNGSIKLKEKQLELLSKFTDLNICISVDGIGPVFEYLRWPAKWDVLTENLKMFQSITKNISISYTISSLNVFYHDQTVNWFKEQNLRYNHNIISSPNWLSPKSMPIELKQLLTGNLFAEQWINQTGNEIGLQEFSDRIHAQDTAKRINIDWSANV